MLVSIASGGNAGYQYIYREASGVYWDPVSKGFISTPIKNWSLAKWYEHIVDTVARGLRVKLVLCKSVQWVGLTNEEIKSISCPDIKP